MAEAPRTIEMGADWTNVLDGLEVLRDGLTEMAIGLTTTIDHLRTLSEQVPREREGGEDDGEAA